MEYIRKSIISKLREMILPLCSGETSELLGLVLNFPVQDRHEHNSTHNTHQAETHGDTWDLE